VVSRVWVVDWFSILELVWGMTAEIMAGKVLAERVQQV
jgi:hypothetical protein